MLQMDVNVEGDQARGHLCAGLLLVRLYGSPKCERAAMRWLERYLSEGTPGSGPEMLQSAAKTFGRSAAAGADCDFRN